MIRLGRTLAAAGARFGSVVIVGVTFTFLAEALFPSLVQDARPLPERYAAYWTDLLRPSVVERIRNALPWTIAIVGTATVVAFCVGTLLGAWLARAGGRARSTIAALPAILLACVPAYIIGMVLVAVVSQRLRWLPPALAFTPTQRWVDPVAVVLDLVSHAILPTLAITLAGIGMYAVSMRGTTVNLLGGDSVTYAESLGLGERRLFWAYLVRPALVPQVTSFGLSLGLVVAGSILVEAVFSYPGLGWTLYRAVVTTDWPLIRGITLVLIVSLALATTLVDLLLPRLDPRLRRA